jgi:S1-C subfamily serine protease
MDGPRPSWTPETWASTAPETPAPGAPAPEPYAPGATPPSFSAVPTPVAAPAPIAATSTRRSSVGPGLVVGAVMASALLASGGTFLVGSATGAFGRQAGATPGPVITPVVAQAPAGGQASIVDIAKSVSPAVVTIVADGVTATDPTTGQTGQGTATGSGIIFDANGLILTNHHVVEGDPSSLTVHLNDGREFDASVYGVDTLTDLAIVKVQATGLPTATIGDSASIQVGQQAIAIGSPLGTFTDSVTSGIISAVGRSIPVETGQLTNLIQTDTAINPGNSGGPLLDPSGKIIGINTAVASQSQGIGFAIPIDLAKPLMEQASAGQPLARPWIGIRFEMIDPAIKKANNLTVDQGALIGAAAAQDQTGQDPTAQDPTTQGQSAPAIVSGSPAEAAGLQAGDIITAVDGKVVDSTHPLDLVISGFTPDKTVTLDVSRNGQPTTISLTLGTRPANL